MHHLKSMLNAAYRVLYLLTMFAGVRAGLNHARAGLCRGRSRTAALDGHLLHSERLGELLARVHPRLRPGRGAPRAHYGLISVRQRQPAVGRLLYRYLCLTSHFGCGHFEIAFYEQGDEVTIYSVRNTARSNAQRIGLVDTARQLRLVGHGEARILLREVVSLLESHGLVTRIAAPHDCIRLSVSESLLPPRSRAAVLDTLTRKYERLQGLTGTWWPALLERGPGAEPCSSGRAAARARHGSPLEPVGCSRPARPPAGTAPHARARR